MARTETQIILCLATVAVLAAILISGCSQPQEKVDTQFVDRLEELGFFRYAKADDIPAIKDELRSNFWAGIYGETGRTFFGDAEFLAEDGVGDFLREITPFLSRQGVVLNQVEDHF